MKIPAAWAALLGTGIVNLVFWLVTAPHMRYGGLYIYTVVALTLGQDSRKLSHCVSDKELI